MIDAIARILSRCGTGDSVLPPTEVFNEGWLLRLVLDWLDRHRDLAHPLSFSPGARWYSEALLPPRFKPQARGDARGESHTHADGVIGHFSLDSGVRGDAAVLPGARQLIVVEAKLASPLSAGITNAPAYDQVARNVACMAHMLAVAGVDPVGVESLGFHVLAPEAQIQSGMFGSLLTKESIEAKVCDRVATFGGQHDEWFHGLFRPMLRHMSVGALSWESVLGALPDTKEVADTRAFYLRCLQYCSLKKCAAAASSP